MINPKSYRSPSPQWRVSSRRRTLAVVLVVLLIATVTTLSLCRDLAYTSWTIASLQMKWHDSADKFVLSRDADDFDVTFANYTRDQLHAKPYPDLVPPILHHIALGGQPRSQWKEAAQSCLDYHPGWDSYLWTDELAEKLVKKRFPELWPMWSQFRYPVERVDALRYMVLYEYGGVILDMDLKCRRALGPLRRFEFVAPEAHPTGFSIGFMMATRRNSFVGDLVRNLTTYDKQWLGMPYTSVMFSTGCHFASVIHAYQSDRTSLKILPGPLHSLNGAVTTPIFDHLGSSSWHSYDAQFILTLGRKGKHILLVLAVVAAAIMWRSRRRIRLRC